MRIFKSLLYMFVFAMVLLAGSPVVSQAADTVQTTETTATTEEAESAMPDEVKYLLIGIILLVIIVVVVVVSTTVCISMPIIEFYE